MTPAAGTQLGTHKKNIVIPVPLLQLPDRYVEVVKLCRVNKAYSTLGPFARLGYL